MENKKGLKITIFFILIIICISLVNIRGIFINESIVIKAVKKQGFSNIKIIEKQWLFFEKRGCDKADAAKFEAIATNPDGTQTKIYVCTGWPFKGVTIRTD